MHQIIYEDLIMHIIKRYIQNYIAVILMINFKIYLHKSRNYIIINIIWSFHINIRKNFLKWTNMVRHPINIVTQFV